MIFCAAADPGGSRALLPVVEELARRGRELRVLDHGFLGRELPPELKGRLCPPPEAEAALGAAGCFLFGSSAADGLPLSLARKAKALGRPTVHVLDNWSGYASRLDTDGRGLFIPDIYAVMDREAWQGAVSGGLPESCLEVTGHPSLAALGGYVRRRQKIPPLAARRDLGLPDDKLLLAFANEPLRLVLGPDLTAAGHYGFTEDQVLPLWAEALLPWADRIEALILPHPKDDPAELAELWRKSGRGLPGRVLRLPEGRAILPIADALAGMASILLYDAWICGWPVLSLQPGVRAEAIRRFSRLPGLHYAGTEQAVGAAVQAWLAETGLGRALQPRPELESHLAAASTIAGLVEKLLEQRK